MENNQKITSYKFDAWVHPKRGGDDYLAECWINAYTKERAKSILEKWLSRRSSVINDYKLITTK